MKFGRFIYLIIGGLCCTAVSAGAEDLVLDDVSVNDDVIAVYGAACEKSRNGEAKSSLRVRATDKASFEAVSAISELATIKKELDPHDFNVMIYDMVDNYVEDLAIRTTKQDEANICVEVTGYLKKDNIIAAVQQTFNGRTGQDFAETDQNPQIKTPDVNPQGTSLAESTVDEESFPNTVADTSLSPTLLPVEEKEIKTAVYVSPTVFFNDTKSETHAQNIKAVLERSPALQLIEDEEKADFVVKSNVLRAKIDPINSNTNRLQMVVSVTLENVKDKTSSTEHQNRFVLFSSSEDEQAVAGKLLRRLFEKATESVLPLLEQKNRTGKSRTSLPQMITPNSVKLHQETDAN